MKCEKCWEELERYAPDLIYGNWLKLLYYLEHERLEDEISEASYNELCNALMSLKPHKEQP